MIRSLLAFSTLTAIALLPFPAGAQYSESTPAKTDAASHSAGPRITYSSVHADGPYIALTFDDGPEKATTPRLLDLLAKRGIKVTFFVLGEKVQENPELLKREVAEGHEIGNHSWSHPNLAKMSDDAVRKELQHTQDLVFETVGIKPKIMRPPYGSFTDRQRKWANEQFGFKIILWEVDPNDWKKPGPAVVAHRILSETRPGSIVLAHDIHAQTIDAMAETLDGLLAKGFKFVTVSELIALDHPGAKPTPSASPSPSATATPAPVGDHAATKHKKKQS